MQVSVAGLFLLFSLLFSGLNHSVRKITAAGGLFAFVVLWGFFKID